MYCNKFWRERHPYVIYSVRKRNSELPSMNYTDTFSLSLHFLKLENNFRANIWFCYWTCYLAQEFKISQIKRPESWEIYFKCLINNNCKGEYAYQRSINISQFPVLKTLARLWMKILSCILMKTVFFQTSFFFLLW